MAKADELTIKIKVTCVEIIKNKTKKRWQFWKKDLIENPLDLESVTILTKGDK